jgi:hypothetical protein
VFAFCGAMLLARCLRQSAAALSHFDRFPGTRAPFAPYFSLPDLQKMQKASIRTARLTGFTEIIEIHVQNDLGTTSTIKGQLIASNFFSVLRVLPLAGRAMSERNNNAGIEAVAVISYRFWKQRFGGDYKAIGKRLLIQRKPVMIITVMPRDFDDVEPGVQPDIWMPLSVQSAIGFGGYGSMDSIDSKKPWFQQDVYWLHVLARSPHDPSGTRLHAESTRRVKAEIAAQLPQGERCSLTHDHAPCERYANKRGRWFAAAAHKILTAVTNTACARCCASVYCAGGGPSPRSLPGPNPRPAGSSLIV